MEDLRDKALQRQTARTDAIRLERVKKELRCAREWEHNWGFLATGSAAASARNRSAAVRENRAQVKAYASPECCIRNSVQPQLHYNEEKYAGGSFEWLALMSALTPKQKYRAPLTSSQEIGWNADFRGM